MMMTLMMMMMMMLMTTIMTERIKTMAVMSNDGIDDDDNER